MVSEVQRNPIKVFFCSDHLLIQSLVILPIVTNVAEWLDNKVYI